VRSIFIFLVLAALVLLRAADTEAWSPVVRGLQARLFTVPHQRDADFTYDVCIEFRNVQENNQGSALPITVLYGVYHMAFTFTDAAGNQYAQNVFEDMRMIPNYSFMLPPDGRISFPIGSGGGVTGKDGPAGRLLSFEHVQQWSLPARNGPYRIAAVYSTDPQLEKAHPGIKIIYPTNVHPVEDPMLRHAWRGTLELPAITLPQK
jgi:hypothetical protein